MSVASHLRIKISEYDARIRTFIPNYEEMLEAAASVMRLVKEACPLIVDLGIGTGALSFACLKVKPRAKIYGLDSDRPMLGLAWGRFIKISRRMHEMVHADFLEAPLPRCHAVIASLSLHHIATRARKQELYERCYAALHRGGVMINADCCPAEEPQLAQLGRRAWQDHLEQYYSPQKARGFFKAWAKEDTYFPLAQEIEMMRAAGFAVEVVWRREPLAVVVGVKR